MKKTIVILLGGLIFSCPGFINAGEVVDKGTEDFTDINGNFAKDKENVYCGSVKIEGANPDELSVLSYTFAKDEDNVYYCDRNYSKYQIIQGADPETFVVEEDNSFYAKDKNNVYKEQCWNQYCSLKITDKDPESFEILGTSVVKDGNFIYVSEEKLEGADVETFEILSYSYAKDKNNVYNIDHHRGGAEAKTIEGADVTTFEVLKENSSYAMDKNNMYLGDKVLNKEGERILNENFYEKLKGKIVLKTEEWGKAYYINPNKKRMYFLSKPVIAFHVVREQGVGITNENLNKIPVANNYCPDYSPNCDSPQAHDLIFAEKQAGKIFIQVEENGEAWYVNPINSKRYFLGRPTDIFNIMKNLGLGISNQDFERLKGEEG